MKKVLLTLALTGIITLSYCGVANALDVNIAKPAVTVDTKKEESAVSKKMKEIEKAKADTKAKQEANKKEAEKKKAEAKKDFEKKQKDIKAKQDENKKAVEKAKTDLKAKQDANKKAAQQRQEQRKDAFDNFKKSFTTK